MKHPVVVFLILSAVLGAGLFSTPPLLRAAAPVLTSAPLSAIIAEGLQNNKELQGMEAELEGLRHEIAYAGSLDDPQIGLGLLNLPVDTFDFSQEPMTQKQIFIAQKVPWFGTLDLRSRKQAFKASRQEALIKVRQLELAREITVAYYDLGFIADSLAINKRLTDLVGQLLREAETRYATGEGLQQNVLQAQVEQSTLLDEKIMLQEKQRLLEDNINELLNRESFTPVAAPGRPALPEFSLNLEALQQSSLQNNPWLGVRQAELAMAEVEIELAKKDFRPDMDFMAAYGQREKDAAGRSLPDFFSATVMFTVPLWQKSRQQPKLAATRKQLEAAGKAYGNLVATLPHRVDALVTEMRTTRENYKLYTDALLIQAQQWAHSSLAGYEVGKVAFDTMIDAQIRLLHLELKAGRYLFNIYENQARLEEVLGGPLPQQPSDKE
jgi:cobalt-zinc-cadmium efflux system outer membrane protein